MSLVMYAMAPLPLGYAAGLIQLPATFQFCGEEVMTFVQTAACVAMECNDTMVKARPKRRGACMGYSRNWNSGPAGLSGELLLFIRAICAVTSAFSQSFFLGPRLSLIVLQIFDAELANEAMFRISLIDDAAPRRSSRMACIPW